MDQKYNPFTQVSIKIKLIHFKLKQTKVYAPKN